jgi:hypothetical protein
MLHDTRQADGIGFRAGNLEPWATYRIASDGGAFTDPLRKIASVVLRSRADLHVAVTAECGTCREAGGEITGRLVSSELRSPRTCWGAQSSCRSSRPERCDEVQSHRLTELNALTIKNGQSRSAPAVLPGRATVAHAEVSAPPERPVKKCLACGQYPYARNLACTPLTST